MNHRIWHKGIFLIELMIGMTIGLILSLAMMKLFIDNNKTYRFQNALARIQENGRFALEILNHAIRMTDFTGCPSTVNLVNAINNCNQWNDDEWWKNIGVGSLRGFDGNQDFKEFSFNNGNRIKGTDAIITLGGNGGYLITANNSGANPPTLTLNQLVQYNEESLKKVIWSLSAICSRQHFSKSRM